MATEEHNPTDDLTVLEQQLRDLPSAPVPDGLSAKLVAAIPEQRRTPSINIYIRPNFWWWLTGTLGAAAAIVVLFALPGVDEGAVSLAYQLKQARHYAVTHRKYVALLMPEKSFLADDIHDSSLNLKKAKAYRASAYRLCIVNADGTFDRYAPGSNWSFLPRGVYVDTIANESVCSDVQFPEAGSPARVRMRGIIFRPNGTLTTKHLGAIEVERKRLVNAELIAAKQEAERAAFTVSWLTGQVNFEQQQQVN